MRKTTSGWTIFESSIEFAEVYGKHCSEAPTKFPCVAFQDLEWNTWIFSLEDARELLAIESK